jgi:hypothetical protein
MIKTAVIAVALGVVGIAWVPSAQAVSGDQADAEQAVSAIYKPGSTGVHTAYTPVTPVDHLGPLQPSRRRHGPYPRRQPRFGRPVHSDLLERESRPCIRLCVRAVGCEPRVLLSQHDPAGAGSGEPRLANVAPPRGARS